MLTCTAILSNASCVAAAAQPSLILSEHPAAVVFKKSSFVKQNAQYDQVSVKTRASQLLGKHK